MFHSERTAPSLSLRGPIRTKMVDNMALYENDFKATDRTTTLYIIRSGVPLSCVFYRESWLPKGSGTKVNSRMGIYNFIHVTNLRKVLNSQSSEDDVIYNSFYDTELALWKTYSPCLLIVWLPWLIFLQHTVWTVLFTPVALFVAILPVTNNSNVLQTILNIIL